MTTDPAAAITFDNAPIAPETLDTGDVVMQEFRLVPPPFFLTQGAPSAADVRDWEDGLYFALQGFIDDAQSPHAPTPTNPDAAVTKATWSRMRIENVRSSFDFNTGSVRTFVTYRVLAPDAHAPTGTPTFIAAPAPVAVAVWVLVAAGVVIATSAAVVAVSNTLSEWSVVAQDGVKLVGEAQPGSPAEDLTQGFKIGSIAAVLVGAALLVFSIRK